MISWVFSRFFGSHNDRQLKKLYPLAEKVHALDGQMKELSDEALQAKTEEFRTRLKEGADLDSLLPEAFAAIREACKRVLNMRPFDCQVIGGIALHKGMIAEMATGEGKTLVATLPAYLNALSGKGVHVITVNDYLANRDRHWMGPVYEFMGLTVGVIQHSTPIPGRKREYACDITYGTNNEFGFDYLRDNMVVHSSQQVQGELNFCIVDEVDSILIDEARTPLIISGPTEDSVELYYQINRLMPKMKEEDYEIEEKTKTVSLTDNGVKTAETHLGVENLYDPRHVELVHHVNQALRAHKLFKKDVDYVIQNDEVIIVDEFTGRLMPGRRFSDGLHQALEAKENVKIEKENQTLASVTFQNYFRMYKKLSGMTGTAMTEASEFDQIYKLPVLAVPTNKPIIRKDNADLIYRTEREKFDAVAKNVLEMHEAGRPVLVGTISIEKSEQLSAALKKHHIPHTILNAKYHEKEAEIVKRAGQRSAVTIATNMAGRGTDIVLGEGVKDAGGLHVIGTERHESRRIDNQLRGRTGRQGDPGSSQFYISLEDDLMRIFGSDRIAGVMEKLGMEEGQSIQHGLVSRSIESAQARVEGRNFDIRKELLKFDDIMNQQRLAVYKERTEILEGQDLHELYKTYIGDIIEDAAQGYEKAQGIHDDDESIKMRQSVSDFLKTVFPVLPDDEWTHDPDFFRTEYAKRIFEIFERQEEAFGKEVLRNIERMILLEVVDSKWKDHLRGMDELREGIGLRAYGQKDPVVEFRSEGFAMFEEMSRKIKEDSVSFILRATPVRNEVFEPASPQKDVPQGIVFSHPQSDSVLKQTPDKAAGPQTMTKPNPAERLHQSAPGPNGSAEKKVGRNEPCPCGSGKKYKKCCGA